MNLKNFLSFVEIQTKIASVFPFLLGSLYVILRFKTFNILNASIMFISLIFVDMTTTSINNYIDFKTNKIKEKIKDDTINYIGTKLAFNTIIIMLVISIIFGILLFLRTNIIVLICGMISFGVGVFYTYGPMPISRTPLGEIFSGFVMGFIIPFLAVYIHIWDSNFLASSYINGMWTVIFNIPELIYLFLFSIPLITCIANIMLANNICDIKEDLYNNRKTLPIWIGERYSLYLFGILYMISYFGVIILVILKVLPIIFLISILSSVVVFKNVKKFFNKHVKRETFILSIKNFILINGLNLILIIACTVFLS